MIDTDTRQLRRHHDGSFYSGGGKVVCDHCTLRLKCDLSPLEYSRCAKFVPALSFNDDTGLDKIANTVRTGTAWSRRLYQGDVVGLYNSARKEIFGVARVVGIETGNIIPMLAAHAPANHLHLETSPREASVQLYQWLKRNYGPRIIHQETTITAIYLLRLHGKNAAPYLERDEALPFAQGGA